MWNNINLGYIRYPATCREVVSVNGTILSIYHSSMNSEPQALYGGVSKNFPNWPPERELQMVQLSASRCSCMAILWVSIVSLAAITLCVTFQRVFNFVIVIYLSTQSGNFWIHPRIATFRPYIVFLFSFRCLAFQYNRDRFWGFNISIKRLRNFHCPYATHLTKKQLRLMWFIPPSYRNLTR
jgi:hypothetical protein